MENRSFYHLPDLQFAKWCEEKFSINRGVYNTIDKKLFDAGYVQIEQRRKAIVDFLQVNVQPTETKKFYKFGQGNLSIALHQFYKEKLNH